MNLETSRVLITGGLGFLGQYVVRVFKRRGCREVVSPARSHFDLTEQSEVRRLFDCVRPDVVVHLAAVVGGIGVNRVHPGQFFYENAVMGTMLMEEAWRAGVEKYVSIGTVCEYPKHTRVPFVEQDLWNGYPEETNAPYGLAKKMALVQGQAYRREYGFNAVHLIPVNLYGPHDDFDSRTSHVIPALIDRCLDAVDAHVDRVTCWGTGRATREFLFVEDCAEGIALATEFYDDEEPVNLGTGVEINMSVLAGMIAEATGFKGTLVFDASAPDGQPRRCVDTTRAQLAFNFSAKTAFEDGLRRTVAWRREMRVTA